MILLSSSYSATGSTRVQKHLCSVADCQCTEFVQYSGKADAIIIFFFNFCYVPEMASEGWVGIYIYCHL